jgi:hypothetical protein
MAAANKFDRIDGKVRNGSDAIKWFKSPDDDLEYWCGALGVNAPYFAERAIELLQRAGVAWER